MRLLLGSIIAANAALFFFGALQHAGFRIGPFHEPHIVPAAIVETVCGVSLLCGAVAVFNRSAVQWLGALIANLIALTGVVIGILALAAGRGPRTASNDLYHRIMLVLIAAALLILFLDRSRLKMSPPRPAVRKL